MKLPRFHLPLVRYGVRSRLALCVAAMAVGTAAGQTVSVVQTNPDQSALLSPQPSLVFAPGSGSQLSIDVDDTVRYQTIEGVGASFTDSAAYLVWNNLTAQQRQQLMRDLFSPSGIHLSFLRQPMGATDLALSSYTYDDVAPGTTDPSLSQFSIAHDQTYIIPTIKSALAVNPQIKVQALPWSPPAWMKTSDSLNGGTLNTEYFQQLAEYFAKFIQAYEANRVPINFVSVQNEPLNENSGYPTMFMTPRDEGVFIAQYLGPKLQSLHLRNQNWNFSGQNADPNDATPGIFGYEHNWDNPYPEQLLDNPAVRPYLSGITFHCYAGDLENAQSAVHYLEHGMPVYFTECSGYTAAPVFSVNLANEIEGQVIQVLQNWGRSVLNWNMALDQNSGPTVENGCTDCRGVVTIDTSTTPATVTKNVEYYVLGHLSKFVQAGAYRIASTAYGSGSIDDVAFKNPDGSIAVLVFNGSSTASQFSINWRGKTLSYTLPSGAVATLTWAGYTRNTFDVTAGPPSQTIAPGWDTWFGIDVDHYGSNNAPVSLHVDGLPAGVSGEPVRQPFSLGWILPIRTESGVQSGTYPVTITGAQGNTERTSSVKLTVGDAEMPYGGTPWPLPGLVQAENFDNGGNFISYFNLYTSDPSGATYRPNASVGVEPSSDVVSNFGSVTAPAGGYDVGYTTEGQWLRYTVNVTQSGIFNLGARVASLGQGGYYHVSFDGTNATGNMFVPATNAWETFTTMVSQAFTLEPGRHIMQITFDGNGPTGGMGNFNWVAVQPVPQGSPFIPSQAVIPGLIQVENFDNGGKGVAYWNSATSNGGGANYRPGGTVYIEDCSDTGGGYDVGNTNPGDWLNFTVNIAHAGSYTFSARVATDVGGGVFHLAVDGHAVTPRISVPQTNGWQTWQTLTVPNVELPGGAHTLQLVMDSGGFYNTIGNFNWFSLN
jgi:glucosylceramidase